MAAVTVVAEVGVRQPALWPPCAGNRVVPEPCQPRTVPGTTLPPAAIERVPTTRHGVIG